MNEPRIINMAELIETNKTYLEKMDLAKLDIDINDAEEELI